MKYALVSPTPPWLKGLTFPETPGIVILTSKKGWSKILLLQQISTYKCIFALVQNSTSELSILSTAFDKILISAI